MAKRKGKGPEKWGRGGGMQEGEGGCLREIRGGGNSFVASFGFLFLLSFPFFPFLLHHRKYGRGRRGENS